MERRSFVGWTLSVISVFLTGCMGGGGSGDDEDDGDSDGNGDETPEETGYSLIDTQFEVVESGGGTRGDGVNIDTDEEGLTVTVEGTLTGRNSCYTAELESAEYDDIEDLFEVNVRSFEDRAEDEMCASVITEIEYRVVASFDGGLPGRTSVSHNGELVAEAVSEDTED